MYVYSLAPVYAQPCRTLLCEPRIDFWHPANGKETQHMEIPASASSKLTTEFELKSKTSKCRRYHAQGIGAPLGSLFARIICFSKA